MECMAGERARDPDKVNDFHMMMMGGSNLVHEYNLRTET